jgi:CubicO group peptidase (beta-lactamase class C family)
VLYTASSTFEESLSVISNHIEKMKKISFVCLFALLSLFQLNCITAQPISSSSEVEGRIKQVENSLMSWVQTQDTLKWSLNQRMTFYNIHGLSLAVINNYSIDWAKGYGWADISEHRLVTPQTLFQAASLSKSLNSVGVLKLVQDKKLDLFTDINQYLKTWKFPYDSLSKNKKITVAQLLSHTAGLTVHGFPGYSEGDVLPSLPDILDGKKPANTVAVRSQFEPGLRAEYSGGGVIISQLIVMDITNRPYDEYMWQNVLKPIGMTNSFYTQPPPLNKKQLLATAYRTDGKKVEGNYHIYPEQAAAGLWTNPTDLCNYIIDTQLSYQGKNNKVLSPGMTKLRLTPYLNGSSALGVFIENRGSAKYFQHSGSNEGFTCAYYGSIDDGKGVVIMLNSDNGAILDEIANGVASVYNWKDFYNPVIKKVISVQDTILSSYVGKYLLNGDSIIISKENNQLNLNVRKMLWKIYFTTNVDFFVSEFKADLKFLKDSQGKVNGFSLFGTITANKIE